MKVWSDYSQSDCTKAGIILHDKISVLNSDFDYWLTLKLTPLSRYLIIWRDSITQTNNMSCINSIIIVIFKYWLLRENVDDICLFFKSKVHESNWIMYRKFKSFIGKWYRVENKREMGKVNGFLILLYII